MKKLLFIAYFCIILYIFDSVVSRVEVSYDTWLNKIGNKILLNKDIFYINEKGLPISYSRKIGTYCSPFYVAQACLLYIKRNYQRFNNNICSDVLEDWPQEIPKDFSKENFDYCIEYLINLIKKDVNGNWHCYYDFDWLYGDYIIKAPWYSGLTDCMCIMLFIQTYAITNNLYYIELADNLYKSVINDRNTLVSTETDSYIEEYVFDQISTKVFNGTVISALCLYYYEQINKNVSLSFGLIKNIKKHAADYDLGFWTRYDNIHIKLVNSKYQKVNVKCLRAICNIESDNCSENLLKKWENYNASFLTRHILFFLKYKSFGGSTFDIVKLISFMFFSFLILILVSQILRICKK